jgi:hypothetical protein
VRKNQSQPNATTDNPRWNYEVRLLAWMATCISVFSFLFYFRNDDVLLYGDAVAHINIARRVFDSKTPGLLQLGTVWLPLPHLLMMPFVIFDKLWRNGVGGSLPSMVSYVFGVIGIFRLTRALTDGERLGNDGQRSGGQQRERMPDVAANLAPWLAAGIYGANPNLIYMQTTAMGEAMYLAFFIWAVAHFTEFVRGDSKALTKCGICLAAASLTRYDGWFLAAATVAIAMIVAVFFQPHIDHEKGKKKFSVPRGSVIRFLLISAAAPSLWLAYNAAVYRNPFEFANGSYSAKAIEKKTATINPASGNLYAAGSYFLKSAELNVAEPEWLSRLLLALAVAGLIATLRTRPKAWPLLLLWIPLPFYALSVAYGAIPIFIPQWWPHSQYNVRYGLELLPAFAVSLALLLQLVFPIRGTNKEISQDLRRLRTAAAFVILGVVVGGYSSVWSANPICYREAVTNMRGRIALENQLANWLEVLPPNSTLLMYLGEHPGIVERADFSISRTINEGNHRVWKQPSDPEGLWERALDHPAAFADYALAFEGDPVFQALARRGFKELVEIKTTGQSRAVLYELR